MAMSAALLPGAYILSNALFFYKRAVRGLSLTVSPGYVLGGAVDGGQGDHCMSIR
jgi:hypothetical protein